MVYFAFQGLWSIFDFCQKSLFLVINGKRWFGKQIPTFYIWSAWPNGGHPSSQVSFMLLTQLLHDMRALHWSCSSHFERISFLCVVWLSESLKCWCWINFGCKELLLQLPICWLQCMRGHCKIQNDEMLKQKVRAVSLWEWAWLMSVVWIFSFQCLACIYPACVTYMLIGCMNMLTSHSAAEIFKSWPPKYPSPPM